MEAVHEASMRVVISAIWGSSVGRSVSVTNKTMDVLLDTLNSMGQKVRTLRIKFDNIAAKGTGGLKGAILVYSTEIANVIYKANMLEQSAIAGAKIQYAGAINGRNLK